MTKKVLCKWIAIAPLALLCGCELAPIGHSVPHAVIVASALRGAPPLVVEFDGSRSSDDGAIVAYTWAFDGQISTARDARCSHAFTTGGTHDASLTVLDAEGQSGTARVEILVENSPPLASFSLSDGAPIVNTPMTADASGSYDREGSALSYRWDLGDGTLAEGPVVRHAYSVEGVYVVTLTVCDSAGADATASHRVLVQKIPAGGGCGGGRPIAL